MFTFSQNGQRVDFQVRQGATLGPFWGKVQNPDGSAVDLTGVTVRAGVYQVADNSLATAFDTSIPTPANGLISFSLSATTTALLTASLPDLPALYYLNISLAWPNGQVVPFANGALIVTSGVDQ